jgi:hypothetical protein
VVQHVSAAEVEWFRERFDAGFKIFSPKPTALQDEDADPYSSSSNGRFLLTVLERGVVATRLLLGSRDSDALLLVAGAAFPIPAVKPTVGVPAVKPAVGVPAVKPAVGAEGKSVSKNDLGILFGCGWRVPAQQVLE